MPISSGLTTKRESKIRIRIKKTGDLAILSADMERLSMADGEIIAKPR